MKLAYKTFDDLPIWEFEEDDSGGARKLIEVASQPESKLPLPLLAHGSARSFFFYRIKNPRRDLGSVQASYHQTCFKSYFFYLVLAVGRCKFHLMEDSVSQILQATIGGIAGKFKTELLLDHSFKFFVSSRKVGLFIYALRSFTRE